MQQFNAIYERDGDWWVATAVEIPGGFSQGKTIEEARENLLDAVYEMTRDSEPGQVSGAGAGSHLILLTRTPESKLALDLTLARPGTAGLRLSLSTWWRGVSLSVNPHICQLGA